LGGVFLTILAQLELEFKAGSNDDNVK